MRTWRGRLPAPPAGSAGRQGSGPDGHRRRRRRHRVTDGIAGLADVDVAAAVDPHALRTVPTVAGDGDVAGGPDRHPGESVRGLRGLHVVAHLRTRDVPE